MIANIIGCGLRRGLIPRGCSRSLSANTVELIPRGFSRSLSANTVELIPRGCSRSLSASMVSSGMRQASVRLIPRGSSSRQLVSGHAPRRCFHSTRVVQSVCRLESRGVIRLAGKDTAEFLQGLVTNDVSVLLETSPMTQYCMMLNVQGRVLYDLFLYNLTNPAADGPTVLVDADASVVSELVKVFKKYKLRKKVDISDVSGVYNVWAQFPVGGRASIAENGWVVKDGLSFLDPRVPTFANRIISEKDISGCGSAERGTETDFRKYRYQWGIPEGVVDLPPGKCLPLESNLEYMNGVNFQKGCYIGQELTARTFHTGVIRKRLLPLVLDPSAEISPDTPITSKEKSKDAGKFRWSEGKFGLGVLRLEWLEDSLEVISKDGSVISVQAQVPNWWPSSSS